MKPALIIGCSLSSAICAAFANKDTNLYLAIAAAVLGIVPLLFSSVEALGEGPVKARFNSIATGFTAGILSYMMLQLISFVMGYGMGNGLFEAKIEYTDAQAVILVGVTGLMYGYIKAPFDLLLGVGLVSRAQSIVIASVTALVAYLIASIISIIVTVGTVDLSGVDLFGSLIASAGGILFSIGVIAAGAVAARIVTFLATPPPERV